jgi:hypothetical protein
MPRLVPLFILLSAFSPFLAFPIESEPPKTTTPSDPEVDPDVLRKVRKLLKGTLVEDEKEREKAWNELREMGNLVTPGLVALSKLKETTPPMLQSIIIALGDSKDPRAGPTLAELLKASDAGVRKNAARAMGDSHYMAGTQQLETIAENEKENEDVRLYAAIAGAKLKSAKSLGILNALLKSPQPQVRSRAVFALGKYGGIKQVEPIQSALSDADENVREDVVEALRLLKEKPAWAGLLKATTDENYRVRNAAMDALRQLTKQKYDNDPKKWQEWWASHKDEPEPVEDAAKQPLKESF